MNSKDRFLKMPEAKLFADMVSSEPCRKAFDYAMLEMQETMPYDDPAFAFAKLQGALRFRRILETIFVPDEAVIPERSPKLDYNAYNRPARPRTS